jgi:hypothetical protein
MAQQQNRCALKLPLLLLNHYATKAERKSQAAKNDLPDQSAGGTLFVSQENRSLADCVKNCGMKPKANR